VGVTTVAIAPTTLTFAAQPVGTTSAVQTVTLTNAGTTALAINSIAVTGSNSTDFALPSKNCTTSLAASSSCLINVAFTPTAAGTRTGTLTITDNASGSPQTVTLNG